LRVNGNLININALTLEYLLSRGIDIKVKADRDLMALPMTNAAVKARGFGWINTTNPSGARQGQAVLKFQF
jgi:hypothetical protein